MHFLFSNGCHCVSFPLSQPRLYSYVVFRHPLLLGVTFSGKLLVAVYSPREGDCRLSMFQLGYIVEFCGSVW